MNEQRINTHSVTVNTDNEIKQKCSELAFKYYTSTVYSRRKEWNIGTPVLYLHIM